MDAVVAGTTDKHIITIAADDFVVSAAADNERPAGIDTTVVVTVAPGGRNLARMKSRSLIIIRNQHPRDVTGRAGPIGSICLAPIERFINQLSTTDNVGVRRTVVFPRCFGTFCPLRWIEVDVEQLVVDGRKSSVQGCIRLGFLERKVGGVLDDDLADGGLGCIRVEES